MSWDMTDLLNTDYTHLILWFPCFLKANRSQVQEWYRSIVPILIATGGRWKTQRLKLAIDGINEQSRKRCRVLLQQPQPEVIMELNTTFLEMVFAEVPEGEDPFAPSAHVLEWLQRRANWG
ncbi:hypothetical protein [Paenibacillus sp. FSL H7-0331]|uniref:hypothetical protein n=1 Tax=Paenibacillus sp. FSL H7-0331 TaxID=1920421 RepID=UPI00117E251F|nr:hypothetical protein [Paenibacillus sp. FSL H7-0331]